MQKIEYSGFAPSFSCYSSDSITSTTVAKVIREAETARFYEIGDVAGEDFEFSLILIDEEYSMKEIESRGSTDFNRDILVNDDVDREIKPTDDEIDASSSVRVELGKMFIDEREESSSCSSSESDELETIIKGKKSSSTGCRSERWILRCFLRRSNGGGKEAKMVDNPKHKRNSGEVSKVGVHEPFYVHRRGEIGFGKRKSYLPYRTDLVGLFANVNGLGKMLRF